MSFRTCVYNTHCSPRCSFYCNVESINKTQIKLFVTKWVCSEIENLIIMDVPYFCVMNDSVVESLNEP